MLYNKCNKQVIHLLRSLKIYSTLLKITRNYKFTMALALGDEWEILAVLYQFFTYCCIHISSTLRSLLLHLLYFLLQVIVDANEGAENTALLQVVPSHADTSPNRSFPGSRVSSRHTTPHHSPHLSYRKTPHSPSLNPVCDVTPEHSIAKWANL